MSKNTIKKIKEKYAYKEIEGEERIVFNSGHADVVFKVNTKQRLKTDAVCPILNIWAGCEGLSMIDLNLGMKPEELKRLGEFLIKESEKFEGKDFEIVYSGYLSK